MRCLLDSVERRWDTLNFPSPSFYNHKKLRRKTKADRRAPRADPLLATAVTAATATAAAGAAIALCEALHRAFALKWMCTRGSGRAISNAEEWPNKARTAGSLLAAARFDLTRPAEVRIDLEGKKRYRLR